MIQDWTAEYVEALLELLDQRSGMPSSTKWFDKCCVVSGRYGKTGGQVASDVDQLERAYRDPFGREMLRRLGVQVLA